MTMQLFTDGDLIRLMDGYPPPEEPVQCRAYFEVFEHRLVQMHGPDSLIELYLLAGVAPPLWRNWKGRSARASTATAERRDSSGTPNV